MFVNFTKWYFLTFQQICRIEIFEKIEMERSNLCLQLYKLFKKISKETQGICVNFWAFLRMWRHTFPNYQLISRQISKQLARGDKIIRSCP